jgi:uncharacterized protein YrrD
MTRRALDVIGKPVVTATSGERLGTVSDLLLDDSNVSVVGLVVRHGLLKGESVLPVSAVQALGADAVVSRSSELISAKVWRQERTGPAMVPQVEGPETLD